MRPSLLVSLLVGSVLATGLTVSPAQAGRHGPARAELRPESQTWEVEGFGKTRETAEEDALNEARRIVAEYLSRKYGSSIVPPDVLVFLREARMTRVTEVKQVDLERSGRVERVTLAVELTPEAVQKLFQQALEQRGRERQRLAALGLGGILALLLVVAGYLRLEDATKGYYTTVLRLAAVSILGLVGVCLFRLSWAWL
jgi:hypothetical protein